MHRHRLVPHPSAPAPALRLFVECARLRPGALAIRFEGLGAVDAIALPAAAQPMRRDGLWRTTCFECFLKEADGPRYAEFNLAPSGEWAAYLFDAERRGMRAAAAAAPRIAFAATPGRLSLGARIDCSRLPFTPVLMAASAVIEHEGGAKTYYALAHGGPAPDFHAPAGYLIDLRAHSVQESPAP